MIVEHMSSFLESNRLTKTGDSAEIKPYSFSNCRQFSVILFVVCLGQHFISKACFISVFITSSVLATRKDSLEVYLSGFQ